METKTVGTTENMAVQEAAKHPYVALVWVSVGLVALAGTGIATFLAKRKSPEKCQKRIAKLEAKLIQEKEELARLHAAATPHEPQK